ncbi:MAG: NADH-quinone oxidoreductase subunit N [Pirellulales bacterium]
MDDALQIVTRAAWTIAPELGMMAAATLLVLLGAFLPMTTTESRRTARVVCLSIAVLVLAIPLAYSLLSVQDGDGPGAASQSISAAPFARDALSRAIQPAALLAGLGLLILVQQGLNEKYPAEHLACLLFIVAGASLVASANDLIALFVSLELISIPTYVLLYLSRPERKALESTIKYFLLSIFSSAFLLYGMSFLLGSAGSTNFARIAESLRQPTGLASVGMLQVALVLVVAGLGFRIAAVPFHFYAPDVFQGTTLPSAALLAIVPKIAGFVALLRLAWSILLTSGSAAAFESLLPYGVTIIAGLAFLTMTVGNVLALLQTDLRRLLAYSSVAHAGYMMVGLAVPGAVPTPNGAQAVLFYLFAYSMMTLGAFGVLVMLERQGRLARNINDLSGLSIASPFAALLLAVFMLSLTGLPPTIGFWGKFNLFLVAWGSGLWGMQVLAVGLAVNAAIAAWYYLRLVKAAYLDPPAETSHVVRSPQSAVLSGSMGLAAIATIGFFFFPNPLWSLLQGVN